MENSGQIGNASMSDQRMWFNSREERCNLGSGPKHRPSLGSERRRQCLGRNQPRPSGVRKSAVARNAWPSIGDQVLEASHASESILSLACRANTMI